MMSETSQDPLLHSFQSESVAPAARPGTVFAARRESLGMSIADVSAKLKLSRRQIEALESDDYANLPGNTFVRGFVRNYARLLELDPQPLIAFLDQHLPKETVQAVLPRLRDQSLPVLRPEGATSLRGFVIAFFVVILVMGLAGGAYWYYEKLNHAEPELAFATHTPPVNAITAQPSAEPMATVGVEDTQAAKPEPVVPVDAVPVVVTPPPANLPGSPPPLVTPAATQPAPPVVSIPATPAAATSASAISNPPQVAPSATQSDVGDVRIAARRDSWVLVTDASGKRLVNELMAAGQVRSVSGKAPYKVRIGNGPYTDLTYKGRPVDLTAATKVDVANLELN